MIRVNRNSKLTGAQKGRILSLYHDHGHSVAEILLMVPGTVKELFVISLFDVLITSEY